MDERIGLTNSVETGGVLDMCLGCGGVGGGLGFYHVFVCGRYHTSRLVGM